MVAADGEGHLAKKRGERREKREGGRVRGVPQGNKKREIYRTGGVMIHTIRDDDAPIIFMHSW
jgi:hypothetical protein